MLEPKVEGNKKRKTMLGTGCGNSNTCGGNDEEKRTQEKGLAFWKVARRMKQRYGRSAQVSAQKGTVKNCSSKEFQESELEKGRWDELMEQSKLETGLRRRTSDGLKKGKLVENKDATRKEARTIPKYLVACECEDPNS